jgi:hypothetical protein
LNWLVARRAARQSPCVSRAGGDLLVLGL